MELVFENGVWFKFDSDEQEQGEEFKLPTHKEVCGRCHGEGVHDHEAFANGITREEFDEDPDFADDYFAGVYNVPCSECNGLRVVDVVDVDALPADLAAAYLEHVEAEAEFRAEQRYAQRMGF